MEICVHYMQQVIEIRKKHKININNKAESHSTIIILQIIKKMYSISSNSEELGVLQITLTYSPLINSPCLICVFCGSPQR